MTSKFFECNHPKAVYPIRATRNSAGYDLIAASITFDEYSQTVIYDTGISLGKNFPYDAFGDVRARSSIYSKAGNWVLCNGAGVVDSDYTDTIKLVFTSTDAEHLWSGYPPYKEGDKIGQIIVTPFLTEGDTPEAKRKGGFGSTGD